MQMETVDKPAKVRVDLEGCQISPVEFQVFGRVFPVESVNAL